MTALPDVDAPGAATGHPGSGYRRAVAVLSLVAAPVLAGISDLLMPDLDGSESDRLAAMAGVAPAISAVTFLVSQLPMLVAFLAIGQLLRVRSRRLAAWGTTLGVLGAFGHTVFGGMSLVWLKMANDGTEHHAAYAHAMKLVESSPAMLFSLIGLAGTVLGVLLLSIGVFRAHVGPRWVGPVLWTFLVVEFVGTAVSQWAAYLSVLCFAAGFFAMAGYAGRRPLESY